MASFALRRSIVRRLAAAGCVAAEEEADELMQAAPDQAALNASVTRRERGEPLAWITGEVRFLDHVVAVDAGLFVPRTQSAALARRAAALLPRGGRAADLCTGTGALAVHLMACRPDASVLATDLDRRAAACARRNGVAAIVADLGRGLCTAAFDVITAVPPYVPTADLRLLPADVMRYEPRMALDGGPDGLDVVRRLVRTAARLLRSGGWLLAEIGGDQGSLIAPELTAAGFEAPDLVYDEEGDLRGFAARLARRG